MENINIEPTKFTPKIIFTPEDNTLEISGFSLPENVNKFYAPLIYWLRDYEKQPNKRDVFKVFFKLSYFNSGSLKALMDIVYRVVDIKNSGVEIEIHWFYDDGDTQILESGKEISEIAGLDFNYHIL